MKNKSADIPRLAERILDGSATQDEEFSFSNWVINDPQFNDWVVEQVDALPDQVNGFDINSVYEKVKPQKKVRRIKLKYFILSMAAMLTGFIAYSALFRPAQPQEQPLTVRTLAGEKARITLPDGSSVILNSHTQLSYAYDGKEGLRNVKLVGEAWFNVRTDPEHPFVVDCELMKVNCRGTEFNVSAYPDEETISVVLKEGKISAMTAREDIEMKPDMIMSLNRSSGEVETRRVKASDFCGWTEGGIYCDNITLDELTKRLMRTYSVNINIQSRQLRQERVRGMIPAGSIDGALEMICTTCGADFSREGDGNIKIYRKAE